MPTRLFDLNDRVALVTGSSRGIGAATARLLAGQGATVVLSSRKAEDLEKVRAQIEADGGQAVVMPAHAGSSEDIRRLVADIDAPQHSLEVMAVAVA